MRFTKRISLFLRQATDLPPRSLLRNPSLCRSYHIVGVPISTSPTYLISSCSGDAVTGLSYGPICCRFIGYTVEQFSDDEYECEFEEHKASSSVPNVDEWKWKLGIMLANDSEREIVSRDKRDRRDYEQISNLAKRMGLYSEIYGKVVVASKVPLPNYRPYLDDKRPQREVVLLLSLQRRVEGLLQEHLDRQQLNLRKANENEADNPYSVYSLLKDVFRQSLFRMTILKWNLILKKYNQNIEY